MSSGHHTSTTYIGSIINPRIDPILEQIGFCRGLILFAIPEYGILFRCRADGKVIDLEFAALFSLMRFAQSSLKSAQLRDILVYSSSPELVASFAGEGRHLAPGSERRRMVDEYTRKLNVTVQYTDRIRNRCFLSPVDYPCVPEGQMPVIKPDWKDLRKSEIKPIQKGIKF